MSEPPSSKPESSISRLGPLRVSCSGPTNGARKPATSDRIVNAPK